MASRRPDALSTFMQAGLFYGDLPVSKETTSIFIALTNLYNLRYYSSPLFTGSLEFKLPRNLPADITVSRNNPCRFRITVTNQAPLSFSEPAPSGVTASAFKVRDLFLKYRDYIQTTTEKLPLLRSPDFLTSDLLRLTLNEYNKLIPYSTVETRSATYRIYEQDDLERQMRNFRTTTFARLDWWEYLTQLK